MSEIKEPKARVCQTQLFQSRDLKQRDGEFVVAMITTMRKTISNLICNLSFKAI